MAQPIMAGAEGERFNKILSTWKNSVYPELKSDDVNRLKKYQEQYEKYKSIKFEVLT